MIYADRSAMAHGRGATHRRPKQPDYDPLARRAKFLSDLLWERAKKLAAVLAPDEPADQEALSDHESWMVLETVATTLNPMLWDDPDALDDLYRLRRMFMPDIASDRLKIRSRVLRKEQSMLPDPSITPESPAFQKRIDRLKRAS